MIVSVINLSEGGVADAPERGGCNDFLGTKVRRKTLRSFGVNPGGYIGLFGPTLCRNGDHDTFEREGDQVALLRQRIKKKVVSGRGNWRRRRTKQAAEEINRGWS